MHRNPIWIAFFSLILLVMLFFFFKATTALIAYSAYSKSTEASIKKIEIVEQNPGKYILWATYTFTVNGEEIESGGMIDGPFFNEFVAKEKLSKFHQSEITVWYRKDNPKETLYLRKFPTKEVISSLVLILIALYFYILGRYVGQRRNHSQ